MNNTISTNDTIGNSFQNASNSYGIATPPSSGLETSTSSDYGIFDYFSNMTWVGWLTIVVILSILGINIFIYLAQGTEILAELTRIFVDFFEKIFGTRLIDATKTTVDTSATGAKTGVDIVAGTLDTGIDIAAGTVNTGLNLLQNASTKNASDANATDVNKPAMMQDTKLSNALNRQNSTKNISSTNEIDNMGDTTTQYEADDSYSSIQGSKSSGKSGWCFIGEERNVRSCIEVGENDKCMSGDIFPTRQICVNPSLRA